MSGRIYYLRHSLFWIIILGLVFFISAPPVVQAALVNINTAGIEELDTLDGIGPAYAQRIIDYRTTNGPFGSIEDIQNVKGIGEATFAKIKNSITVGSPGSNSETQNTPISSTVNSSHYGAESISTAVASKKEEITFSAGRDRVGVVGGRLEFKIETNAPLSHRDELIWNFGDGTIGSGEVVTHTYDYPGEYIVILNGKISGRELVSRVSVKINPPELEITAVDPTRIEITNKSKQEANMFGRAIISKDKYFIFPKDTIIGPGQKISFSSSVTGLKSNTESEVKIIILKEGALTQDIYREIERANSMRINAIQGEISQLQQKIISLNGHSNKTPDINQEIVSNVEKIVDQQESQTALAINSVNRLKENKSSNWFQVIKNFFFKPKQ